MIAPFFVLGGPCSLEELKRLYFARVLQLTGGNLTETARILEVDRSTICRWRDDYESPVEAAGT